MLQISGKQEDIDKVMMPSVCLHLYRTVKRISVEPRRSGMYWAIQLLDDNTRIAYLIKENERSAYQRPGIKSIIPAFLKEK